MQYKYSTKSLNKQNQKKNPVQNITSFSKQINIKKNKIQTIISKLHYLQNIPNTHFKLAKTQIPHKIKKAP